MKHPLSHTIALLSLIQEKAYAVNVSFGGNIPVVPGAASGTVRSNVTQVLNLVLGFLALIALIFVIIGAIRMMVSRGNQEQVTEGRKTIIYALLGLVVVFFAKLLVSLAASGFTSIT